MNDRSAIRAQPSARGRQAVSDGNNRRSEKGLYPPGRKDSPSTKPAGLSSRRAGVFRYGFIEQLHQYQDARRLQAALALVDDVFKRIMPSNEREMAADDAAKRIIGSLPLRCWTIVDVKRLMKTKSNYAAHRAIAYLVMEGEAMARVASGQFGGKTTYCHPDYREEPTP